jgi:sugar-specific transcriptional regulator TrmB
MKGATMPASSSTVLEQASDLLKNRIKELEDERARLERALADLTGGRIGRRRPGRPRGSATRKPGTRRRRGGTRADQAAKLVKANPGITAGEVAKRMGIAPNYVYRVMSELESDGRVKKDGRKYTAA